MCSGQCGGGREPNPRDFVLTVLEHELGVCPARRACLGSRHYGGGRVTVSRPAADPRQERAPGRRGAGRERRHDPGNPNTIPSEANEAHPHPEPPISTSMSARMNGKTMPLGPCATCGPPSCRCGEATDTPSLIDLGLLDRQVAGTRELRSSWQRFSVAAEFCVPSLR